ncbi:MAG: ABC transporter permease subunit [Firmicutes bacterium]|nr:ABC transporter permease subunit [Bacillota bacterium]MDD4694778.1 ABC transporter permease subunit [Bacillota bacterium]
MISLPLLRATIKQNYKVFIIFLAVLTLYFVVIAQMFEPSVYESMDQLMQTLPIQLIDAVGLKIAEPSLIGYLAGYYYGFLIVLLPLIYSIIVANRIVAKHVDKGSMAYLLSTPNKRVKIAMTQGVFLLGSMTLMILFVTVMGIISCEIIYPKELDIPRFVLLNFGALLLHSMLSGIGFLASCFFNDTKNSLGFGAGFPIFFLLVQMLLNANERLSNLRYLTLLTLFNPEAIIGGTASVLPSFIAMFLLAVILYGGAVLIFSRKDLSI